MFVVLGVTGCIGAYKAAEVLRGFQREGIEVSVVMTTAALIISGCPVTELHHPPDRPSCQRWSRNFRL